MTAALLAHQGGWDEIVLVLVPIVIFAALLIVANRRANSMGGTERADGDGGRGGGAGTGGRGDQRGRDPRPDGDPPLR